MRIFQQIFTAFYFLTGGFLIAGCSSPDESSPNESSLDEQRALSSANEQSTSTLFKNGMVWNGSPDNDFQRAAIIINDGYIQEIFYGEDQTIPETDLTIDLEGRYLMPGLINAHGHVGVAHGLQPGPPPTSEASRENVISQLKLYAKYGVTTVVSLGDEPPEAFDVRNNTEPEDVPIARIYLAGEVLYADSADEADSLTRTHLQMNPDWLKIRVDDGLGTQEKLPEEVYAQIIETGLDNGVPLAAHIVTLEDAKSVLNHDAEIIGHSVRDAAVDSDFIDMMLQDDICITPTLTRELSTFVYATTPDFFSDPFFLKYADPEVVEQLQTEEVQRQYTGRAADYYREALPLAQENLHKLYQAGVRIAMGTDSGPAARFQGYFEHLELQMMQDAGMPVKDILVSSTSQAAECMNIDELTGTIEAGKKADFLVLEENPFESLLNLRDIWQVYIGGVPVDRAQ